MQSLRISNACANSEFSFQTYSTQVTPQAGEDQPNKEFTAQFSFISKTPNAEQPGLFLSVSPDSYEGSRMSWVGLEDTPQGIHVTVRDTPASDGDFIEHDAGILDRTVPHTIKFWVKLNPGPDNDLVRVSIDGADLGQCFSTWENYYRTSPEQTPPPNVNTPADINSLQFRSSIPAPGGSAPGGGYLFDNVSVTTANGLGPPGCDLPIAKRAVTRTVRAGGLARYRITVRNRGRVIARNMRVCDHIPRRMTFVSSNRTLSRIGRARCLLIRSLAPGGRVSFRVNLRVRANAPTGREANIADVTPVEPPGATAGPVGDTPPARLGANGPAKKAAAAVRILGTRFSSGRRQPRFTG